MAGAHCVTLSLCLTFVWFFVSAAVGDSCASCSYTYADDGTTDRECVSDPQNHAHFRNISCNFTTHHCEIRAVYRQGYDPLVSLTRSCSLKMPNSANGCDKGIQPTCVFCCTTDGCNLIDGDLHKMFSGGGGGPTTDDGGTGSASTVRAFSAAGGLALALYSLALGSVVGI